MSRLRPRVPYRFQRYQVVDEADLSAYDRHQCVECRGHFYAPPHQRALIGEDPTCYQCHDPAGRERLAIHNFNRLFRDDEVAE